MAPFLFSFIQFIDDIGVSRCAYLLFSSKIKKGGL